MYCNIKTVHKTCKVRVPVFDSRNIPMVTVSVDLWTRFGHHEMERGYARNELRDFAPVGDKGRCPMARL